LPSAATGILGSHGSRLGTSKEVLLHFLIPTQLPESLVVTPLYGAVLERLIETRENVIIIGPGGIGKSTLLRYLEKELSERGHVVLIFDLYAGTSADDIVASIARTLAEQAALDGAVSDDLFEDERSLRTHRLDAPRVLRRLLDLAKARLGERQLFLFFDGLDESAPAESRAIKQLIDDILWRGSLARVVMSSRAGAIVDEIARSHKRFVAIRMEPLRPDEASEFVLRRFGNRSSGIARDVVDQIVEISEGVPLALQLLSAQFETTGSVSIPAVHTLALGQIAAASGRCDRTSRARKTSL
jgi:energy-coupling factor transporter ATP-binding protein EcfA2